MDHHSAFLASLETVAERCEDVVPPVYEALFARFPEVEKDFVLDIDFGARGHMLNEALSQAEGLLTGDVVAQNFLTAERLNHIGYGIDEAMFTAFFEIIHQVFAEIAADAWTSGMTAAWAEIITRVETTKT